MKTVYFAHHQADYNTRRSTRALLAITAAFDENIHIVNPSTMDATDMDDYIIVAGGCEALAFLVNEDGTMGPGVAKEVLEAHVRGRPIYSVVIAEGAVSVRPYHQPGVQTIEQARADIRKAKGILGVEEVGSREANVDAAIEAMESTKAEGTA